MYDEAKALKLFYGWNLYSLYTFIDFAVFLTEILKTNTKNLVFGHNAYFAVKNRFL